MNSRMLVVSAACLLPLVMLLAATSTASAQTPFRNGLQISLLPGYKHEVLQGIDSLVGKIVKKDGLQIQYDMGPVPKGGLALGGSFVNQAAQRPQKDRLWIKEQTVGGRKVSVAYSKGGQLIISSASAAEGINFSTTAKTSEDVADALLMVLSLSEKKGEKQ